MYIKRSKSRRILHISLTLMLIAIGILTAFLILKSLYLGKSIEGVEKIVTKNNDGNVSTVNIIRAVDTVEPGELVDITKFEIVTVPDNLVPQHALVSMEQLRDRRVKIKLTNKQFVLESDLIASSAWYDNDDRLIEHTFQQGMIPTSVVVGSIIDIKLFRQNAEDAVVVSKVVIVNKLENTLSLYLNSNEQEYLKEAATEGLLFITQYLDASQAASEITYTVNYENN